MKKNKDKSIREKIKEILSINDQKRELTEVFVKEMEQQIQEEVDSYVLNQIILSKQLSILAEEAQRLLKVYKETK